MNSTTSRRARRGILLAAALGAVAVLALAGLAAAKGGHGKGPRDHRPAGTIASYDPGTQVLTVELGDGGSVSGLVTRRTRIGCGDAGPPPPPPAARRGESEPGDDRGAAPEPGEDRGEGPPQGEPGEGPRGEQGVGPRGKGPGGHDDNGFRANCDADDLTAGTVVKAAKLELIAGKAFFRAIALDD